MIENFDENKKKLSKENEHFSMEINLKFWIKLTVNLKLKEWLWRCYVYFSQIDNY